MISLHPVSGRRGRRAFHAIGARVYHGNPLHRSTEDDVMRMLVEGRSAFLDHARVDSFLMRDGRDVVGRFALIQDHKLPEYAQVSFFEALPGLHGVLDAIRLEARVLHPECSRLVVGLNGHLNYGAGFLASRFDEPPLFGLPYTPPYYLDYFDALPRRPMVSYRFASKWFFEMRRELLRSFDPGPVRIRVLDRAHFDRDVDIYTDLNNACFQSHPYWANRTATEDWELFHPFRHLIKDENLIIAEIDGRPVGFLLWYPDFNELLSRDGELGAHHVLRYRLDDPIRTVRLTEIAVLPEVRRYRVDMAMILRMIQGVEEGGYAFTEGGFVFEENRRSIALTLRYIQRATGSKVRPYRRYCVFDGPLSEPPSQAAAAPSRPASTVTARARVHRVERAQGLPAAWDALATSAFQRRDLLGFLERTNPCSQRYYELRRGGDLVAGAVVYSLGLDLLTYSGIESPVRMHIVGIPCSQSASGLMGDREDVRELMRHVLDTERGLVIGLNLDEPLDLPQVQSGRTLPAVVMRRRFTSWDDYVGSLRSSYRRRLRRIRRPWRDVAHERGPCDRFDDEMYAQYLAVFERSDAKLEKLPATLFRALPDPFTLTTHRLEDRLVGWHIGLRDGDTSRFFMVGMDYAQVGEINTHANVVLDVIGEAIDDGAAAVDLGQTAEISKTRAGGRPEEKYLFGYHRSRVVRGLLGRARPWIEYGTVVPETHVFRSGS